MDLATEGRYGAPAYGPLHGRPEGWVLHTPENESIYLSSARAVADWQASGGNTSGGSYHCIPACRDGADPDLPGSWVILVTVPWGMAAGSLATRRDAIWRPDRYPILQQRLSRSAYDNPNAWLHAVAWSGKAAWYRANGIPRGLLVVTAALLIALEDEYQYDSVLSAHAWWQTDRSDPGPTNAVVLLLQEYWNQRLARFSDVPPTHQFAADIEWAADAGLVSGYGDGTFRPDAAVTRGQLAAILHRYDSRRSGVVRQADPLRPGLMTSLHGGGRPLTGPYDPAEAPPTDREIRRALAAEGATL